MKRKRRNYDQRLHTLGRLIVKGKGGLFFAGNFLATPNLIKTFPFINFAPFDTLNDFVPFLTSYI